MTTTNLDHLKEKDFTIIVDRSGSMSSIDRSTGKSRWKSIGESVEAVANKLTELDPDGITVYEFSSGYKRYDNTTGKTVHQIFDLDPNGSTRLAECLNHAFADYLNRKSNGKTKLNGELAVVVTDGQPDNEEAVSSEIVKFTKRLDSPKEFQLIFMQVGDDTKAAQFLNNLDDDLEKQGAKYDIVSVIGMDKVGNRPLTDVLTDAITEAKIHA